MKKFVGLLIVTFVTVIVFLNPETNQGSIVKDVSHESIQVDENVFDDLVEEDIDVFTECQDCLASAYVDNCLDLDPSCFELPDCYDWLNCVGWCEALEGDDDCYQKCDDGFVDSNSLNTELKNCACETCGIYCRTLCGVEGY